MLLYSQAKLNFVSHFLHYTQLLMGIGTVGMGQELMSLGFHKIAVFLNTILLSFEQVPAAMQIVGILISNVFEIKILK